MLEILVRNWWTFAVRGIAAVVFGILAIAMPLSALAVLVAFFGAYALIDGLFAIVGAVRAAERHDRWSWLAFEGVVGVLAGFATFFYPAITAIALLYLIACWAIITGVLEIATAVRLARLIRGEWVMWLAGIISILFGVLLIVQPVACALAVALLVGYYAILFGVTNIVIAFRLRRLAGRSATA